MSAPDAAALLDEVLALRSEVDAAVAERLVVWSATDLGGEARASVENLARYLALRRHDLADLQRRLARMGLSSLGRAEARVSAQLDAVAWALAHLTGRPQDAPAMPSEAVMWEGERVLATRTRQVFGPPPTDRRVRVVATLPSIAAEDPEFVRRLLAAGADGVRINTAHDGPDAWRAMAAHAREAATDLRQHVSIEVDLAGPKVRVAAGDRRRRHVGDAFWLVPPDAGPAADASAPETDAARDRIEVTLPSVLDTVAMGDAVWFDDGKLGGRVERLERAVDAGGEPRGTAVLVRVEHAVERGVRVRVEKGVNVPDTVIDVPVPTADDLAVLPEVLPFADAIGFSFVQRPSEVDALHDTIAAFGGGRAPALVLKIETRLAVRSLPALMVAALRRGPTAVMIARGDLAVELGFERLAEIQEELLWVCEAAHVPVIWATQVLEGMAKRGMPTRAEVTDAAMAERAEGVLLNKGPYAEAAVRSLADVLRRMHRHQSKKTARLGALRAWDLEP